MPLENIWLPQSLMKMYEICNDPGVTNNQSSKETNKQNWKKKQNISYLCEFLMQLKRDMQDGRWEAAWAQSEIGSTSIFLFPAFPFARHIFHTISFMGTNSLTLWFLQLFAQKGVRVVRAVRVLKPLYQLPRIPNSSCCLYCSVTKTWSAISPELKQLPEIRLHKCNIKIELKFCELRFAINIFFVFIVMQRNALHRIALHCLSA